MNIVEKSTDSFKEHSKEVLQCLFNDVQKLCLNFDPYKGASPQESETLKRLGLDVNSDPFQLTRQLLILEDQLRRKLEDKFHE